MVSKNYSKLAQKYSFKASSIVSLCTKIVVIIRIFPETLPSFCSPQSFGTQLLYVNCVGYHNELFSITCSQDKKYMFNGTNVFSLRNIDTVRYYCLETIAHTRPMSLWKETHDADVFQSLEITLHGVMKTQNVLFTSFTCWCRSYVIIQRQKWTLCVKNIVDIFVAVYVEIWYGDLGEANECIPVIDAPLSFEYASV